VYITQVFEAQKLFREDFSVRIFPFGPSFPVEKRSGYGESSGRAGVLVVFYSGPFAVFYLSGDLCLCPGGFQFFDPHLSLILEVCLFVLVVFWFFFFFFFLCVLSCLGFLVFGVGGVRLDLAHHPPPNPVFGYPALSFGFFGFAPKMSFPWSKRSKKGCSTCSLISD